MPLGKTHFMIVPLEDALVVPNKKIYSKYFTVKKRIFVNFTSGSFGTPFLSGELAENFWVFVILGGESPYSCFMALAFSTLTLSIG